MYQQNYGYNQQQQAFVRPQVPVQQAIPQQQTIPIGLKGRPVSSIEEARASLVDFDGSVFYFPDLANKKIYTKQINLDGTATLNMYELKEIPVANNIQIDAQQYVTRQEFESAINALRAGTNTSQEEKPFAIEF